MAKKKTVSSRLNEWRKKYLKRYKSRLQFQEKKLDLKASVTEKSHSLLWVWEFSKKAVLICFIFYVIVQVYAMVVMVRYLDFSYLGTLVEKTGDITRDCVFAYLIKAGLENIGKIWFQKSGASGPDDPDEPVG